MKTVKMTLDENLLVAVDKAAKKIGTTRSGFTGDALHKAFQKLYAAEFEQKHCEGYRRKPVKPGEFTDWEGEQAWVECDERW